MCLFVLSNAGLVANRHELLDDADKVLGRQELRNAGQYVDEKGRARVRALRTDIGKGRKECVNTKRFRKLIFQPAVAGNANTAAAAGTASVERVHCRAGEVESGCVVVLNVLMQTSLKSFELRVTCSVYLSASDDGCSNTVLIIWRCGGAEPSNIDFYYVDDHIR